MKLPIWPNPKGYRDIKYGLKRIQQLLKRLGNPHLKLPPTIHIAGTNGKGSTLAFLRAIFKENGYSVDCYISPHLVEFNERIIIGDLQIEDAELDKLLQQCQEAAELEPKIEVSFFEGITAAAFLAFSKSKADILLLETGMGGRFDATNVIKKNLMSIITPISLDHTEFLGKTTTKIAKEKAGIIKKDCPVIISHQESKVLATLLKVTKKNYSPTRSYNLDWKITKSKDEFFIEILDNKKLQRWDFPLPSLLGDHQLINASTAIIASLTQQKFKINYEKTKSAIKNATWQARLQKITSGKFYQYLVTSCKGKFEIILDGSHNLQGAKTIESWLEDTKTKKNTKNYFIFAMLENKDCTGFLKMLKNEISELMLVEITNENKAIPIVDILAIANTLKINAQSFTSIDSALQEIVSQANKSKDFARIIVCGSLYLAGNFLEENSRVDS